MKKKLTGRPKTHGPSSKMQVILEKSLIEKIKTQFPENSIVSVIRLALKSFLK